MSYDPDDDNPLLGLRFRCTCCGEECGGKYVDNGIGGYEYWGYRGRHTQMDLASDCCEKDVRDLGEAEGRDLEEVEDDEEQAQPA